MLDFDKILKIYNDLEWELVKLQDVANLTSWGYFESLLSNIDWHIYFLYRIKNKPYFDYFLLDKNFWEQAKKEQIIKKNKIRTDSYNYINWFKVFDKLKNNEDFIKYFNNYKYQKLEKIINKQKILSFSQTLNILQQLKKYKSELEIDFFDFDINDYDNFSKSWFTTEKSIVSDFLRKSAIYDFDFEKFYLLKKEELDKKILLAKEKNKKVWDVYHDLWILNTYYRFYKLYKKLIDLSYFKIILLKIANAGNIFDENKKYLLSLLIFHFSKDKQEANKIRFIFQNHFVYFVLLIGTLLILVFWNTALFFVLIIFLAVFYIIFRLIIFLIEKLNLKNLAITTFTIIIFSYWLFSLFTNSLIVSSLKLLPKDWLVSIFIQDKNQINEKNLNKKIKEIITELYNNVNIKYWMSNVVENLNK